MHVVDLLNDIEMTEPIRFREDGIESSFFRLTAAWDAERELTNTSELVAELRRRGANVHVEKPPAGLLYHLAAFRAQFPQYVPDTPPPVAERQTKHCFAIHPRDLAKDRMGDGQAPISCEAANDD